MNIKEANTKELLETAATLSQQSLAEFRSRGPGKSGSKEREQDIARGDLIEALLKEARTRDDYEAAKANREFESRAVTELPVTSATNAETRNERPVAVTRVNEPAPMTEAERRAKEEQEWVAAFRASGANPAERRTSLSAANRELDQGFKALMTGERIQPIEVPIGSRNYYRPGAEQRDLLKTGGTGTQSFSTNVYDRIIEHLVESSAVIKAGATVLNTPTGENLIIPKTTGLATSAIVAEGATISESDPTFGNTTLGAYKYAHVFDVSYELLQDGHTDFLDVVARLAAESLAQKFGDDLINGDGSGKPRGILLDAGLGKTGPAGTATSFGTQATAGQGTDLLYDTVGALAEPYANSSNLAWLMRNATLTNLRKLKDSAGNPVAAGLPGNIYVDPFVPAQAIGAKSVIVGDFSRYVVRFAGPLRFERSDHFKFNTDLVTFKVAVRLDAATVDNNAFKYFANGAS